MSYLLDTSCSIAFLPSLQTMGSCPWRSSSSSLQMVSSTRKNWRTSSTRSTPTTPSEPGPHCWGWGVRGGVGRATVPLSEVIRRSVSHSPEGQETRAIPTLADPTVRSVWPPLAGAIWGVGVVTSHWQVCLS